MALSSIAKGSLAAIATTGTAATPYVAYKLYENNSGVSKKSDTQPTPPAEGDSGQQGAAAGAKNPSDSSYKDVFSPYNCAKEFGTDILSHKNFNTLTESLSIDLNNNDFLSVIDKAESGCFRMETQESENKSVGFVEFSSKADKYAMIMKTKFNLGKDNPSTENVYFLNELSFLKKKDDGSTWELDKSLT